MAASSTSGRRGPSVLACEIAAALPQSHVEQHTDGEGPRQTYPRPTMFARVLTVLDSRVDGRDALVLGAQLADEDGALFVAHVLESAAVPLAGGTKAAASRRDRLRDYGEEVYATLGPDPRARYVPVSGLLLPEAAVVLAEREKAGVIVIGQNLLGRGEDVHRLVDRAPCPLAVAPYGHRFARGSALARIALACVEDEISPMLRDAHLPVLLVPDAGIAAAAARR
jgi:hypothetical protein